MESTRGGPQPVGEAWEPNPFERGWDPHVSQVPADGKPGLSGKATASLILGVIGLILGIPGLVLGIAAIKAIHKGEKRGLGIAIAGVVLNALWLLVFVAMAATLLVIKVVSAPEPPAHAARAATLADVELLYPSQAEWDAGWRAVVCVVHNEIPRSGSLRDLPASPSP